MATTHMMTSYADYSGERSSVSFWLAEMTAATHDAVVASQTAINAALEDVSRGQQREQTLVHSKVRISNMNASDTEADREAKLLVVYEDNTTKDIFTAEIPCVDKSALTRVVDTDFVVLNDAGAMAALVTALETHAISRNGNAISVIRGILVGRNI
jgi:hypothetical protein